MKRLPEWIREKRINLRELHEVKSLLRERSLHSVCESLACPNRTECFSRGTATFMILGDICTRSCGFCNVTTGRPYAPPSPLEPRSVADAAKRMGLRHVVVTSVTRDDLEDGGAKQFADTIRELRHALPQAPVAARRDESPTAIPSPTSLAALRTGSERNPQSSATYTEVAGREALCRSAKCLRVAPGSAQPSAISRECGSG